ncbi:hypothetical protein [Streptomyces sp. NPDC001970]
MTVALTVKAHNGAWVQNDGDGPGSPRPRYGQRPAHPEVPAPRSRGISGPGTAQGVET